MNLLRDLRYALRQLRKSPGFAFTAILTLALGIGATTAIFSVVNAVCLKPLNYPHPDRIVQFLLKLPQGARPGASVPDFHIWREQTRVFQDVSAYNFDGARLNLTGGVPEQIRGIHVTAGYFRLFGAPMLLGRTFTVNEDRPNSGKVVVLSYSLWKRKFSSDQNIVGKSISLEKEPFTILGVTGREFHPEPVADLWIPFQFDLNSLDQAHYFQVAGRLNPGITLEQANAQLKLAAKEAQRSYPLADPQLGYEVQPLRNFIVGDVQSSLLLMGAAVGFVLLIACANVANLLLVRATGRKHEFTMRAALGASRGRILCQLLAESVVMSSIGGVLGLGLGWIGVRELLTMSPGNIPRIGEHGAAVELDWRMLAFTLSISIFTGILFGLFPALSASRTDLHNALNESGNRQGAGFRQNKTRSLLVISEVSLAVVLLIGAALLIRSFIALREVKSGFDTHNVLVLDMSLAGSHFSETASVESMVSNARQRIEAIPGVQVSAATCCPPLKSRFGLPFIVIGRALGNSSSTGSGTWMDSSPGYFNVLKIPILRGRDFTEHDDVTAPRVVVINEAMAKKFWPNQNPLGQQILIGKGLGPNFEDSPRQIIGIVGNTRDIELSRASDAAMIIPQAQEPDRMTALGLQFGPIFWLVRTRMEPHQLADQVAKQLREASGGLPVGHVGAMSDMVLQSISRQNFNMFLLTIFALCALVLAAIGIYGVVSYSTAQRTQEIGIRMALGADRATIRRLVLLQGMLLATIGALTGVCAAFGLVHFIASFLFGVTTWDPIIFLTVPLLLTSVSLLSVWLPARRAASIEPLQALRGQ